MARTNNGRKIIAPVNMYDIQAVLQTADNEISRLCRSTAINMWSKFKPVRKTTVDLTPQLNSDLTWKLDSQLVSPWWKGSDGNYGLDFSDAFVDINLGITSGTTGMEKALSSLALKIDGKYNGWTYLRPQAGSHQHSELDFLGYNHAAPKPCSGLSYTEKIVASLSSPWRMEVLMREPDSDSAISTRDYVTPKDITSVPIYTGIAIFKKSNNTYVPMAWVVGSNVWNGKGIGYEDAANGVVGRGDTEVIAAFRSKAKYYAIPIYCTTQLAQPSTANASSLPTAAGFKVLTVPFTEFVEFTAERAELSERIGYPDISNHNVRSMIGSTEGTLSTGFTLDSTGDWYLGTQGGTTTVQVLIVNSQWNGDLSVNTTSSSCAFNHTYTDVTLGAEEIKTIGLCTQVRLDLTIGGWRVVMVVGGDIVEHALKTNMVATS